MMENRTREKLEDKTKGEPGSNGCQRLFQKNELRWGNLVQGVTDEKQEKEGG